MQTVCEVFCRRMTPEEVSRQLFKHLEPISVYDDPKNFLKYAILRSYIENFKGDITPITCAMYIEQLDYTIIESIQNHLIDLLIKEAVRLYMSSTNGEFMTYEYIR